MMQEIKFQDMPMALATQAMFSLAAKTPLSDSLPTRLEGTEVYAMKVNGSIEFRRLPNA
jgi:hypothetical protein